MTWVTRQYSKSAIDRAGQRLIAGGTEQEMAAALDVVNNWRSCHAFPLNTMQMGLRRIARQIDDSPLVAQRIKRLSSIELKLRRFPTMTMSQMQDLGGCRAIVADLSRVLRLAEALRRSRVKHKLHTIDNYIERPQDSGYRGVHLIYKYYSDKSATHNGQKIEIQLRSASQHSWATAVETVGTFTRNALKSSIGPERWLRFFALMGSVIAIREGSNLVEGTPDDRAEIKRELHAIAAELDVVNRLVAYGEALTSFNSASTGDAQYFLIQLDFERQQTLVEGFKAGQLAIANAKYLEIETQSAGHMDAVLVSVESISVLQRAYPNYFLDTSAFVDVVREALSSPSIRKRRTPRFRLRG